MVAVLLVGTVGMSSSAQAQQAGSTAAETPVVFVHGNGDDAAKWIGVMWLFESNSYAKNHLYAIRFSNPMARTDDTKEEAFRSSTTDAAAELSSFVTRVLIETHSKKVALVGSSRGGMTIRNYLEHGGAGNVSYAVLCGTPNHGVTALDGNPNAEFNGKGIYLQALNHVGNGGMEASSEVVDGVKMMTLRSDTLDKYAQPTGIALGNASMKTGVSYDGPALKGAENVVLTGLDHRELAFQPRAFAEMYRFITGKAPQTLVVKAEEHPVVSGLVTGFMAGAPTNQGLAGVGVKVFAVGPKGEAAMLVYEGTTAQDGHWGPLQAAAGQEYVFDLAYQGRHVRYYKAPIPRSTALLNLRFLPVPKEAAALTAGNYVLVARPQAYFSRDRDPVEVDGVLSKDEPAGLPLRDSFLTAIPSEVATVRLRNETLVVRPSGDLGKDLPVADFLW
ncbi:MAG: lipase class 2 [Acidobacteriaceae bacterium]|nr:lipase class 2 [Acidobacteriaceae bacterium]